MGKGRDHRIVSPPTACRRLRTFCGRHAGLASCKCIYNRGRVEGRDCAFRSLKTTIHSFVHSFVRAFIHSDNTTSILQHTATRQQACQTPPPQQCTSQTPSPSSQRRPPQPPPQPSQPKAPTQTPSPAAPCPANRLFTAATSRAVPARSRPTSCQRACTAQRSAGRSGTARPTAAAALRCRMLGNPSLPW